MNYTYQLHRQADRYLARLSASERERVLLALRKICTDPFDERTSSALHGPLSGHRRSRVGATRIVFRVMEHKLVVFVTAIGPRGDVYKS